MRHVMVDIETLGTKPGSVILSIGACEFGDGGVGAKFYRPVDVFDSLMHGLAVDQATVGFWRLQSAEARGALQPALPMHATLVAFQDFLTGAGAECVWAKGPDFDLVLLQAAYEAVGLTRPWAYRNARDVRTILALAPGAGDLEPGTLPKHHALADAEYQARQVIAAAAHLAVSLDEMA
jgi:hypothetical protein